MQNLLAERKITIELTQSAKEHIAREGYDPVFGARPLKRVIQQRIQNELAMRLLRGEIGEGASVLVDVSDGEMVFKCIETQPEQGKDA